jgi:periplasmic divalent cation tolerance protein
MHKKQNKKYVIIFVTAPSEKIASQIGKMIISKKLAACVNIIPEIRSLYRWKNKICNDKEFLIIIKSSAKRFNELAVKIQKMHPYEIPEIISIPITKGSNSYMKWLSENIKP